jgi:hypothetical protein
MTVSRGGCDGPQPVGDLRIAEARCVELQVPHLQHGYADDVAPLEGGVRRDVDPLDRKWPVEPDAAKRAVRLLAQMAAGALVQGDAQRRRAVGAQPREREAPSKVPPEHG